MEINEPEGPGGLEQGVYGLGSTESEAAVVLLAVPFDATASYGKGTHLGPAAILKASLQVDLYDVETGRPYQHGIVMLDADSKIQLLNHEASQAADRVIRGLEAGQESSAMAADLAAVNRIQDEVEQIVYTETKKRLDAQKMVGVVGGDHSVPLGAIRAVAEAYPGLGILHVDAHADLRVAYEGFEQSHASIMHNVLERVPEVSRIVQVAVRDLCEQELNVIRAPQGKVRTYFDSQLARARLEARMLQSFGDIVESLPEHVYLSFDIDGLDPKLCPNTGTPVPGGLTLAEVSFLLERVVRSGRRIVGFDLCEVAPGATGEWDGNVGARLLYKIIGWSLTRPGIA